VKGSGSGLFLGAVTKLTLIGRVKRQQLLSTWPSLKPQHFECADGELTTVTPLSVPVSCIDLLHRCKVSFLLMRGSSDGDALGYEVGDL
jgi:hypothetical protein